MLPGKFPNRLVANSFRSKTKIPMLLNLSLWVIDLLWSVISMDLLLVKM